ncbi:MAG: FxsA family protein [Deltaproteobacteria bacterium]|nr:FxsA family protein [Deltaproteobacteria bacterium]MBW2071525.1 FxsA family protein [Deltaproteobacteria bacterium]
MFLKLFLGFTLVPIAEIYLLIKIGSHIGALNTIAVVIVTGILGASLARLQGLQTLVRVRQSLEHGELPAEEMLDALLIFVAGVVLLTPGFITDLAGLALLIPQSRNRFKRWLRKKFDVWMTTHPYGESW